MAARCLIVLLLLVAMGSPVSVGLAATPVKMRPYSGIGVAVLSGHISGQDQQPVPLYREPGLSRLGTVKIAKLAGNQWIFGEQADQVLLIVTARKGNWLRVCYDDAGREAWIEPQRRDTFQSWDQFLKSRISRLLPGLRKQYYQLCQQPDQDSGVTLTPRQTLKVLKVEHDWAMVLSDQTTVGWLRWRDEDGRLTLGLN